MSKVRSDSVWARLKPEQRDQLMVDLLEKGSSLAEARQMMGSQGIRTSEAALSNLLSRHGLPWRLERARERAEESAASLPADWDARKRRGFAQREFELAFSELSAAEVVAMRRLDLEERKLRLTEREVGLKERRIALLESAAASAKSKLESIKKKGGLTADTLKQIEEAAGLL